MANGKFASTGVVVGQTGRNRREQRSEHLKGNKVTMGKSVPRQTEGTVGDITVRDIATAGLRCYIKTDSGWIDINTMQGTEQTIWINMNLSGSWATDDTYGTPQYFKDTAGFVHFRGGVDSGAHSSSITTLPVGFRPQFDQRRLVNRTLSSSIHIQLISITSAGVVNKPYASTINLDDSVDLDTTAEICIDGISFFAGQAVISQGGGGGGSGGAPPGL